MSYLRSPIVLILTAIVFALIAVTLFGQASYQIDGATVSLGIGPALSGSTEVVIPPIGTIAAQTHKTPVKASIGIERVSVDGLKRLADSSLTKQEFFSQTQRQATVAVKRFLARLLFLAAAAGAAASLALSPRSWRRLVLGTVSGLLVMAVLISATFFTYDYQAFRQPKYTGVLTAAPWLISSIEDKLNSLDAFRQDIKQLATNLHYFYARVEKLGPDFNTGGTVRVLHVSDIHDNPAGMELVKQVASDFHANFVIDTGDITDYGTPMEAGLAARVKELGIPYIFVPGNHDSPQVAAELQGLGNVRVVKSGALVTVDGISILGYPDPFSTTNSTQQSQSPEMSKRYAADLAAIYRHLPVKPDVVAVHEPADADALIGKAKVVLSGHTHQPLVDIRNGTELINAGTSGAAGIRTFKVEQGIPYTLKLLYFQKDPVKLMAIDSITIKGIQREFTLERTFLGGTGQPPHQAPAVNNERLLQTIN